MNIVLDASMALAWLLHQPGMTAPIIGASTLEQLNDTVKGVEVKLTSEELQYLAEPYKPHQVLGHH